jgi:organic hydroperoxide reductase OsmC/OhrA
MAHENVLGRDDRPRFFQVGNADELGLGAPTPRRDVAIRARVRSLAGMQKEATVSSSVTGAAWRLVSDEGPYLAGHDEAPFPLAFMGAGIVGSYWDAVTRFAEDRGAGIEQVRLTLDNYYTMEGSALRGTMTGGALAPELRVEIPTAEQVAGLHGLCTEAVEASPVNGLLHGENLSRFTITHNGREVSPGKAQGMDTPALPDPGRFDDISVTGPDDAAELMRRVTAAEPIEGEGGAGSSLKAEQKRTLHVRSVCTLRPDRMKQIDVQLFKPVGSNFRFLSEEPGDGAPGRGPDADTLVAAGLAFCFMTQLGRYATIAKKPLERYRIVQDLHFTRGEDGGEGDADPVETHVHIDSPEDEDFARTLVDMGEQTCFLHALCRTDLSTKVTVTEETAA